MTALETMAAFVADGVRSRVPPATRAVVRLHVIDTVGAWVAGAHTAEGRALIAFRGPAPDLATACAVTRSSEIDNIHLASTTTPGGIVIPAALVIAAMRGEADTDAVCEAIVAGTEAMVRLAGHPLSRYMANLFRGAVRGRRSRCAALRTRSEADRGCARLGARSRVGRGRPSQRGDDGALVRDRQRGAQRSRRGAGRRAGIHLGSRPARWRLPAGCLRHHR